MEGREQGLATDSPSGSGDQHLGRSAAEIRRFASRNGHHVNKIFGDNLTLQRDTFMVVGLAMLFMLPLIAWVRSQQGNFHPSSSVTVIVGMASCVPAIFSSRLRKFERFAGHLLLTVIATCLLVFVVLNGGLRAPMLVTAPLLPLAAAFLLGPPAGLLMAGAILISVAALVTQFVSVSALPAAVNAPVLADPLSALATGMLVAIGSIAAACIGCGFNRRFLVLQKELLHLATHDPLTDLANRKLLESALLYEAKKRRTTYPVSLIVLDIDHFKRFNDSHGHQAGDRVLKAVANIALANAKRSNDVIARYGGDEFVIVLPNTSRNDAIQVAERLRKNVERQQFRLSRTNTHQSDSENNPSSTTKGDNDAVTLSVGVATHPAGHFDNPHDFADDLMARADLAMYRSKQAGGNRVTASENALKSAD